MRKNHLNDVSLVTSGNMASDITSDGIDLRWLDNIIIYISFSGTPTGTFSVEVSPNESDWYELDLSPVPAASGTADTIRIDINQLGDSYLRLKYTRTSGTGTLNSKIVGKML